MAYEERGETATADQFSLDRRGFIKFIGAGITVFIDIDPSRWAEAQESRGRGYPADFNE
jgi:hypothetical protein